jgi:hypothetical protein
VFIKLRLKKLCSIVVGSIIAVCVGNASSGEEAEVALPPDAVSFISKLTVGQATEALNYFAARQFFGDLVPSPECVVFNRTVFGKHCPPQELLNSLVKTFPLGSEGLGYGRFGPAWCWTWDGEKQVGLGEWVRLTDGNCVPVYSVPIDGCRFLPTTDQAIFISLLAHFINQGLDEERGNEVHMLDPTDPLIPKPIQVNAQTLTQTQDISPACDWVARGTAFLLRVIFWLVQDSSKKDRC